MEQVLQGDETLRIILEQMAYPSMALIRIASMSHKALNNQAVRFVYQAAQTRPLSLGLTPCMGVLDSMLADLKTDTGDSITFAPLYTTPAPYTGSCELRCSIPLANQYGAVVQEQQQVGSARSFRLLSKDSLFWDERLPYEGAPQLDVNKSLEGITDAGLLSQTLANMQGPKLIWLSSSKKESICGRQSEALCPLFGVFPDRVSISPKPGERGYCDLRVTMFMLADGMESALLNDDEYNRRMHANPARTSSKAIKTSPNQKVKKGEEAFVSGLVLTQPDSTIYWNNQGSTNDHPSIAVVVQFPLNYPVTRYLMACKMQDYRQQYLASRIHECSNCGRMVKLTKKQTKSVFVRVNKINSIIVPFTCDQGGYLKCKEM